MKENVKYAAVFDSSEDITYSPKMAVQHGKELLFEVKETINEIELGSKMRKESWMKDIKMLVFF